jgi:molecular chaperone DnaK
VGWEAREWLSSEPERTFSSIKRMLGRTYSDPTIGGFLHSASFQTRKGPNDSILVDLGNDQLAVGQVCSAVFGHASDLTKRTFGTAIKQVVLTHPVNFNETQLAALKRAAEMGGWKVIGMLSEPVAAALAYGIGSTQEEIVAVYDFGGGTFDFTLLQLTADKMRVLGSGGDSWLGGDDFDSALAAWAADLFWQDTHVELQKRVVEWQRLLIACEAAKRELSEKPTAWIDVPQIIEVPDPRDILQAVDRGTLERQCKELFARSIRVCEDTLAAVGLTTSQVTSVVVTGGVSRIPFVQQGLSNFFDRFVAAVVNPEEAIALGAGLHAARLSGHGVTGVEQTPVFG